MKPDLQRSRDLVGVMNDTKWEELRLSMYGLGHISPQFQIKILDIDQPSEWDGEWYYHFRLPSDIYSTFEWCDLRVHSEEQRVAVLNALRAIHLPGEATEAGFRIHGWVNSGESVRYIE